MKNVSDKFVAKIKTHILSSVFFLSNNHSDCAIMWENDEDGGRAQMTIWCMGMACWITKATETCSLYVTLIAFPLQPTTN
jgi:hypothetical protein